jgi:hypothetical protein
MKFETCVEPFDTVHIEINDAKETPGLLSTQIVITLTNPNRPDFTRRIELFGGPGTMIEFIEKLQKACQEYISKHSEYTQKGEKYYYWCW